MQFRFKGIARNIMDVQKIRFTGEQQFFHYVQDLFGKRHGLIFEMEAGEYNYPFEYILPLSLPYSAEGKFGEIYYGIKIIVDIPHELDKEIRLPITVIRYEDLNALPLLKYPKVEEISKTYCYLWLCCVQSKPLTVKATIPYSGFSPGSKMPIFIEIDNQSHVDVRCIKMTLKGLHTFHFDYPSTAKHVEKYRLDYKLTMGCQAKKTIKLEEHLRAPEMLMPSNDRQSKIFQITYVLKICAIVSEPHKSLFLYLPLTIGSFPLTSIKSSKEESKTFNKQSVASTATTLPDNKSLKKSSNEAIKLCNL
jgi:hypothetical protein